MKNIFLILMLFGVLFLSSGCLTLGVGFNENGLNISIGLESGNEQEQK